MSQIKEGDGTLTVEADPAKEKKSAVNPKKLPPYHVVLLNDDDHTFDYVIEMLRKLFGHPRQKGMAMARRVDSQGRAIVLTTTKEHAELKRDQIRAYGCDWRLERSRGSMKATIEPSEG